MPLIPNFLLGISSLVTPTFQGRQISFNTTPASQTSSAETNLALNITSPLAADYGPRQLPPTWAKVIRAA